MVYIFDLRLLNKSAIQLFKYKSLWYTCILFIFDIYLLVEFSLFVLASWFTQTLSKVTFIHGLYLNSYCCVNLLLSRHGFALIQTGCMIGFIEYGGKYWKHVFKDCLPP